MRISDWSSDVCSSDLANSADLIRQARRELDGADAYVKSQRTAIARRLHAPGGLDDAETDAWIDKPLRGGGDLFSSLARRLPLARTSHEFVADAQALHHLTTDLLSAKIGRSARGRRVCQFV